ncbi:MAG TPA: hypothetical protein VIM65_01910, partial [Cyclobacteriaceae bacterium]
MHYTQKKTSFQNWGGAKAGAQAEINRTVPIVSKEKIELKIFQNGKTELFIENLPTTKSLFSTEAVAAKNNEPQPQFYQIKNGTYSVYDANRTLIFEEPMPELSFGDVLERVKKNKSLGYTLPAMVAGGTVLYPVANGIANPTGTTNRSAEDPLHNSYDDDPAYEVIRTPFSEKDQVYTQELIRKKSNNTMVWVSAYNADYQLISRSSFRYGGTEQAPTLLSTQYELTETTEDGTLVHHTEITEYENFEIDLNL